MGLMDEDAFNQALLTAGLGILANNNSRSNPMQALGRGGLMGLQAYGNAQEMAQKRAAAEQMRKLHDMQMQESQMKLDEMKRAYDQKMKIESLARNSVLTPEQQAIAAGGPTPEGAAQIPYLKPKFDTESFLGGMMGIDPLKAMEMRTALTPKAEKVSDKERLVVPDGKGGYKVVLDSAPDNPTAVKEYLFGTKNPGFNQWLDEQNKSKATKVNVPVAVKVGNTFGETVAKAGADRLMGQVDAAAQVPQTVAAGKQIIDALNTGKVMAGPGTTWKVAASQLFGGDSDKLNATRSTIQGLAKLGLGSRQSLRGQGTITDAEQKLLERAVAGDIDGMTVGEIRLVVEGTMKNSQFIYSQGQKASEALKKMPEFSSILPAFDLPNVSFPNTQQAPSYPMGAVREKR